MGVPLLILAYDNDIDSYTGALTKGAAGYLIKPVGADEFTAAAQKLCDWKRNADRSEKRRRLRRPLLMKVDVDIRARKVRVPGELVDASGAGCRIELKEELSRATSCASSCTGTRTRRTWPWGGGALAPRGPQRHPRGGCGSRARPRSWRGLLDSRRPGN